MDKTKWKMSKNHVIHLFLLQTLTILPLSLAKYRIGVGIADCTGPAAEIVFMGYARPDQHGCGIHLRQFSRAFIFDDGIKRAVFVSVDAAMMSHGVREAVLSRLSKLYDHTYTGQNVLLSGTHTHCTPGGFLMYFMYDIPTYGFVRDTFNALVDGITRSITRAHENMVEGEVYLSSGELLGASINRSPASYLLNPEEERAKYKYNVDKDMVQLKLIRSSDRSLLGAINWFAVHPTSMNNTNCLISSDNVGYASVLLEKKMNKGAPIGKGPFVAAFASSNLGDVSPNVRGPKCLNTGQHCDAVTSTCDGHAKFCVASGPGEDIFDSTEKIAKMLLSKAESLLEEPEAKEVTGPIKYVHRFVNMAEQKAIIKLPNGTEQEVRGCPPAMGYSFAAGTTDGPGQFDFTQATRSTNVYWNTVRDLLFPPTPEDVDCQHPKPILVNTGRISTPYEWQPRIVSTQLVQVGKVVLIAVPGEFTTMAGRRLREAVKSAMIENGASPDTRPIIAGLSNIYSSYITTPEEYQLQRYEGASTIYGPHTLTLYMKTYRELAQALVNEHQLDEGPSPPDFSSKLVSLAPGVVFDTAGLSHSYGDCVVEPPKKVKRGTVVRAVFISGHPRNDLMQEGTFLIVEKLIDGKWSTVATDADWETKFIWKRTSKVLGGSKAIVEWQTGPETATGTYRIRHFGHYKSFFREIYPYAGSTDRFEVE